MSEIEPQRFSLLWCTMHDMRSPVALRALLWRTRRFPSSAGSSCASAAIRQPRNLHGAARSDAVVQRWRIVERHPDAGVDPPHGLILTPHVVDSMAVTPQIVAWCERHWVLEQFLGDSKIQSAIAANAAAIVMRAIRAESAQDRQAAGIVFPPDEIALVAPGRLSESKTGLQPELRPKNPLVWVA